MLWGVHMVQTGVQRTFGPRLRGFLAAALSNRFKALGAGAAVTVALQSSTATGLMLTAFAAGGLVELAPALAVMLGANMGTTVVVQLLSFDVVALAPILVLAGVVLFRRTEDATRDFGRVLIGLGLMLTALHQFLVLLDRVVANPDAHALLAHAGDYIPLAILGAALLTWAAHSSVATVLLAMSLAAKGMLPLDAGVAIVLGANLGSAINPLLEGSRGSDPASRRVPIGNLLTRVAGVVVAVAGFRFLLPYAAQLGPSPARALANFHTLFNLALAAAFLPWIGGYAKLIVRVLPQKDEGLAPGAPLYLDPSLRETPALALGAATRESLRMADTLEAMLAGLRVAIATPSRGNIDDVRRLDDVLDSLNSAIKAYLISIAPSTLKPTDGERLAQILAFATNLEHAGDLIDRNLLSVAKRRLQRGVAFSPEGEADLVRLVDRVTANVRLAASVVVTGDEDAARRLVTEKEALRAIEADAVAAHYGRLQSGNVSTVETSSLHLDALRDLKQVNSHLIEGAAYPLLTSMGALLPTRLRSVGKGA
ncbi:Na/Pi cotransporter family protein [Phenylobacterium sp.]|uniref:Na/Pi cotransporter family protein n=1 Tax=Phenylobacterium sp. TaxID=1871053 RepID=UPI0025ED890B|nr:Na/Pi cotransporter family protein [Phenylobacterium sp.]